MGWRATRMVLDRPALFRAQVRALLRAVNGGCLDMMVPMLSTASEMDELRNLLEKELTHARRHGYPLPSTLNVGAMVEVPSLLFELDALLPKVDFVSVGSNDLLQFLYAADRTNAQVANRYEPLSIAPMRALKYLITKAREYSVPLTVCGEMAGNTLSAMALIGLGCHSLSMAASSVGPVKAMILSLDAGQLQEHMEASLSKPGIDLHSGLRSFAEKNGVEL